MARAVIIVDNLTPEWQCVARCVVEAVSQNFSEIVLLDVTSYSWPSWKSSKNLLKVTKKAEYVRLQDFEDNLGSPENKLFRKQDLTKIAWSSVSSFIRDNQKSLFGLLIERKIVTRLRKLLLDLERGRGFFRENDAFFIPNGRFAHQALIKKWIETKLPQAHLRFFETAESDVVLLNYPIHDRLSRQLEINNSQFTDFDKSRKWLSERKSFNSTTNEYSRGWGISTELNAGRINLFLTSSADEYWALGPDWHTSEWHDQYEAFDLILSRIYEQDEKAECILRVHPNLLNKSLRFIFSEIARLYWICRKHPRLVVYLPNSNVNTYSLINVARRVFVSISTAGLEASAQGKPVWCVMDCNYDLVADIQSIRSKIDIQSNQLEPWSVNPNQALRWIEHHESTKISTDGFLDRHKIHSSFLDSVLSLVLRGPLHAYLVISRRLRLEFVSGVFGIVKYVGIIMVRKPNE